MKFRKREQLLIIYAALIISLNACTSIKTEPQPSSDLSLDYINIQRHIDSANIYFKAHDFYHSLIQWKILHSIQPNNTQYKNRIKVLNRLIERRIKNILKNANLALKSNNTKSAKTRFLAILMLKPNDPNAIQQLKIIEANKETKKQARKTKKYLLKRQQAQNINASKKQLNSLKPRAFKLNKQDHEQSLFYLELGLELFDKKNWRGSIREINKYLTTNPSDKKAINILITSHINLSKIFEDRGHVEPAIQHMEDAVSLEATKKSLHFQLKKCQVLRLMN